MSDRKVSIVGTQGYAERTQVASGSVEADGTTLLRAIGDWCPIAK